LVVILSIQTLFARVKRKRTVG